MSSATNDLPVGNRQADEPTGPTEKCEGVVVRRVNPDSPQWPDDAAWMVATYNANQRDAVAEEERATNGFIQGKMSVERLEARREGPGMWLAEIDGERAGAALSSGGSAFRQGPPGMSFELAQQKLPGKRLFVYGPAVVDAKFRRRGVLGTLLTTIVAETVADYDYAIGFVEHDNVVSRTVHEHLGFTELAEFTARDRDYSVLALDLRAATERHTG